LFQRIGCNSLSEIVQFWSNKQPEKIAFTFLGEKENETESITYSQLDTRAKTIAAELISRNFIGERILLLYEPGLEFICAFLGCLYAGAIAVPAYPPDPTRLNKSLPRLAAMIKDCGARFALTSAKLKWPLQIFSYLPFGGTGSLRNLSYLVSEKFRNKKNILTEAKMNPDNIAFLQYTSGTTGTPKGVIITNENLLENLKVLKERYGTGPASCCVNWLPLYHDMGLIGCILHTIFVGANLILMSPLTFLKNPLSWPKAMSKYRATHTAVPNFALDLCVRRFEKDPVPGLDLSELKFITLGGEQVRKQSMEKFFNCFKGSGLNDKTFYPAYGLAEGTLYVCGGETRRFPVIRKISTKALAENKIVYTLDDDTKDITSCGISPSGGEIKIVDPETRLECPVNQVGEIWINAPYVGRGYWNNPDLTKENFHAALAANPDKDYLKSGDLGFIDENGELYITGRLSDTLVISNKIYYPQDIEKTIEENEIIRDKIRIGSTAAFSAVIEEGEKLVIFLEIKTAKAKNGKGIIENVTGSIGDVHNLPVHGVFLLQKGKMPKTTSGKLMRYACKKAFLSEFEDKSIKIVHKYIHNRN
jgi:acyl-CoA synthetase (AMP-forming)/AMP-acid ligase II